jgi:branched-chain amino acid transport system permease protein
LGTAAFFGTGVYTAVVCIKALNAYFWTVLLAGGVVSRLLGLGIGYLTRWLRGVSFSLATLALTVALQTMVGPWDYVVFTELL